MTSELPKVTEEDKPEHWSTSDSRLSTSGLKISQYRTCLTAAIVSLISKQDNPHYHYEAHCSSSTHWSCLSAWSFLGGQLRRQIHGWGGGCSSTWSGVSGLRMSGRSMILGMGWRSDPWSGWRGLVHGLWGVTDTVALWLRRLFRSMVWIGGSKSHLGENITLTSINLKEYIEWCNRFSENIMALLHSKDSPVMDRGGLSRKPCVKTSNNWTSEEIHKSKICHNELHMQSIVTACNTLWVRWISKNDPSHIPYTCPP